MANTAYATPAMLKADIQKTDATDDATIQRLLNAAAFCIDHWSGRKHMDETIDSFLAPALASARLYSPVLGYHCYTDECVEYTLVEQKDSPTDTTYVTLSVDDYVPFSGDPERPNFNSIPYDGVLISAIGSQEPFTSGSYSFRPGFRPSFTGRRRVPTLRITGRWGYAQTTPPVVTAATILLASRWFKRGQSAWSAVLASAEAGTLTYLAKDADVMLMIQGARLIRPSL